MCLFERANTNYSGVAYKKGVTSFECGACPECLAKKSRRWALRAVYEAQESPSCMVTLTYDTYIRDGRGRVIGEEVADRRVDKRDVQLFIKRLRKWCTSRYGKDYRIKYLITAEYGKKTHRPHYHALLFGVNFPDVTVYKRSKRGHVIYKSDILTRLWNHGICTVDTQNLSAACARYCTKYCAKDSRAEDTFMLFSRGIGEKGLLRDFNGKSYIIDGREYPIPRQIWEKKICEWYRGFLPAFSPKYVSPRYDYKLYQEFVVLRRNYIALRDSDPSYQAYIQYWKERSELNESKRPSVFVRITQLPDVKYHAYKIAALQAFTSWNNGVPVVPPRSGCISEYYRYLFNRCPVIYDFLKKQRDLPLSSCYTTANDTLYSQLQLNAMEKYNRKRFKKYFQRSEVKDPFSSEWFDCPIEWRFEDFSFKF